MDFFRRRQNLGLLLLGIWLILSGLLQFGVTIPYAALVVGGLAIVAGVLIILNR